MLAARNPGLTLLSTQVPLEMRPVQGWGKGALPGAVQGEQMQLPPASCPFKGRIAMFGGKILTAREQAT